MSPKPPITFKEVKYRKIKSVDTSALVNYLAESSLCNVSPGCDMDILSPRDLVTFAQNYNMTLSQVLDSHAPLKTKTIVARPAVLRYNEEIDKARRLHRKAERKWRETKLDTDFQLFKRRRNHVTYLLNQAKRIFTFTLLKETVGIRSDCFVPPRGCYEMSHCCFQIMTISPCW